MRTEFAAHGHDLQFFIDAIDFASPSDVEANLARQMNMDASVATVSGFHPDLQNSIPLFLVCRPPADAAAAEKLINGSSRLHIAGQSCAVLAYTHTRCSVARTGKNDKWSNNLLDKLHTAGVRGLPTVGLVDTVISL